MEAAFPYGNRVLITGGTSGIGLAAARMLAAKGYRVVAASRRGASGQEMDGIATVRMDVRNEASIIEGVKNAVELLGGIDIVIHSAGLGVAGAAEDTGADIVSLQMETGYMGVVGVNRHVLGGMRQQGHGLCIIIGSVAGLIPIPYQAHYSACKYALEGYAQALRMEIAPFGVNVCIVEPGDLNTGFTAARTYSLPEGSAYGPTCRRAVAIMERDEKAGGTPDGVARIICRLCGKKSVPVRVVVGAKYKVLAFIFGILPPRLALAIVSRTYHANRRVEE
nr:SDR family NAD(P)-dependent oxidoreductase [bacterium]